MSESAVERKQVRGMDVPAHAKPSGDIRGIDLSGPSITDEMRKAGLKALTGRYQDLVAPELELYPEIASEVFTAMLEAMPDHIILMRGTDYPL